DRNGNYRVGCYNFAECGRECCALHLAVKEIGGKPSGLKGRRHLFVLIDREKNAPHGISPVLTDVCHGSIAHICGCRSRWKSRATSRLRCAILLKKQAQLTSSEVAHGGRPHRGPADSASGGSARQRLLFPQRARCRPVSVCGVG